MVVFLMRNDFCCCVWKYIRLLVSYNMLTINFRFNLYISLLTGYIFSRILKEKMVSFTDMLLLSPQNIVKNIFDIYSFH